MPVETMGALVIGSFGAPIRLKVWQDGLSADCVTPAPRTLPHATSREALTWAHLYVSSILGWPVNVLNWSITHAVDPTFHVPPLKGGSIFGAFALAFMRSVALEAPKSVKPGASELGIMIVNTRIDRIGISAGFNPKSGQFQDVGRIDLKLTQLTALWPQTCRLCVVAKDQPIPFKLQFNSPEFEQYALPNEQVSLPVVRAVDPMDAMDRVFSLQAVAGLTCHR